MSVSLDKDTKKTSIKHNNRTMNEKEWEKNKHINRDLSHENNYLVQENIKELYEKEFGEAQEKFNQKQKRKDRKIKNYYEHIRKGKRAAVQQEMILQVGDRDDFKNNPDNWKMANEILEEWFRGFEKRNPNLKIYNAVIHNDESSPHLHINFVPVASGYKRGLDKQVGFNRAILQQDEKLWAVYENLQVRKKEKGYELTDEEKRIDDPFATWRENEVAVLERLLNERGIDRHKPGPNKFKDMNEFKMMTDGVKKLEKQLKEKKVQTAVELKRFERTQNLNKEIEKPKKKEGLQPIIVPTGWEPMPKVDVQQKRGFRGGRYEVDPAQVESLERWAIDQKEKKEKLEGQLEEKDKRLQQLVEVVRTQDVEVKQLVEVVIASERQAMLSERQSDYSYIKRLEEEVQGLDERVELLEGENSRLNNWKNRALDFMERIGVREQFEKFVNRVRGRDFGK